MSHMFIIYVILIHFGSMDKNSMEKLREASAAEAEAASAVWHAVQAQSSPPAEETSVSDDNSQIAETLSDGSDTEADVRLHPRAVRPLHQCPFFFSMSEWHNYHFCCCRSLLPKRL